MTKEKSMANAVLEPELEEKVDTPDVPNENDDEDRPGWLINYVDGKQPIVVRLEGTDDEELGVEDVFDRFDNAVKGGKAFFKLGNYRGRVDLIRDLAWSEDVDLPELMIMDTLQDRIDAMLDGLEEVIGNTSQITGGAAMTMLMGNAGDYADEDDGDDDEDDDEDVPPPSNKKARKLPPGVR